MLRIGVLGLGNISQKAYLPVMAQMQADYDWYLCTRNAEKGHRLAAKYGFTHVCQTVDELIATGVTAVFVHTPTATHAAIITQLLTAGIHVYVDKPVATDPEVVDRLYKLAAQKKVLLTCGFNRRFAPNNVALKQKANKQLVVAEKTRAHTQQEAEFALWDLMIHPLDTALWLADEPVEQTALRVVMDEAGVLRQAYYVADGARTHVEAIVNMDAQANLEQVTVQAQQARLTSTDLLQLRTDASASSTAAHRPDWEPVLETRGFAPLIRAFLQAVSTGGANPVSPESVLVSHRACAALVAQLVTKTK